MANLSEAAKAHKKEINRSYNRERYWWLKENGFCVTCGYRYAVPGRTRCKACADKMKRQKSKRYDEWYAERRAKWQERRDNHLCVTCGAPAVENRRRCEPCLMKMRDYFRVYKIRKKLDAEVQAALERSRR